LQRRYVAFDFSREAFIAFDLRQFDQFQQIGTALVEINERPDGLAHFREAAHDFLRRVGIVPQFRCVGLFFEFLEFLFFVSQVKDSHPLRAVPGGCVQEILLSVQA
jgi:hypothetical protein